jgi:DNA polymerase-3 subunit epsilon
VSPSLRELRTLLLDCQASGATPDYGDVLELGWSLGSAERGGEVHSRWVVPRTERPIGRAVRELTGWTEACLAGAVHEGELWKVLLAAIDTERTGPAPIPTLIHFARFELRFLEDWHTRLSGPGVFPFDPVCLHAIASRLFPDLPRRNIRALAGYLGHAPELVRRAPGHVQATAFIWAAVVPLLEQEGIHTWTELKAWLEQPAPKARRSRRSFPLAPEVRRALPDRSGVYRFLRRNGDVIYVGKAVSLKKRVASHFKSSGPATERALELLTQVHSIEPTETASLLEAALLECDEIKRLDPPYNVQLRAFERSAWFSTRDFREAVPAPDATHPLGPLPSERALFSLEALIALADGEPATPARCAAVLAVPAFELPEPELFAAGWATFRRELIDTQSGTASQRVQAASRALYVDRGRAEAEAASDEAVPAVWDFARVRRRLERNLIQPGLLVRRSRFLCLLVEANVAFRERVMPKARALVISRGRILQHLELDAVGDVARLPARRAGSRQARQREFDAATYDRLRVLVTELRRVIEERGEVALTVGGHHLAHEKLARWLREL